MATFTAEKTISLNVPADQVTFFVEKVREEARWLVDEYIPEGAGPDGESLDALQARVTQMDEWATQLRADGDGELSGEPRSFSKALQRMFEHLANDLEDVAGTWRRQPIDVDAVGLIADRLRWLADAYGGLPRREEQSVAFNLRADQERDKPGQTESKTEED